MSARFSLKITTLCHSVRSRGSPDWRSFQRSEVAIRRLTIFWLLWLWRTSGSRPRLPTRITLFTLPAIACPPPPREASPDPACPSRRWAREPPLPVKRGRAYQELLASNSECRRPLRLPREGRRQGQAGGVNAAPMAPKREGAIRQTGPRQRRAGGRSRCMAVGMFAVRSRLPLSPEVSPQALDLLWRVYRKSRNNPTDTRNRIPDTCPVRVHPNGAGASPRQMRPLLLRRTTS